MQEPAAPPATEAPAAQGAPHAPGLDPWIGRAVALIVAVFGFLPLTNWITGGYGDPIAVPLTHSVNRSSAWAS